MTESNASSTPDSARPGPSVEGPIPRKTGVVDRGTVGNPREYPAPTGNTGKGPDSQTRPGDTDDSGPQSET